MKKIILGLCMILLIGGGVWWYRSRSEDAYTIVRTISVATLEGDQEITGKEKAIVEGGRLTVNGNLRITGALVCKETPLNIIVNGAIKVDGVLGCGIGENMSDATRSSNAITLVATDGIQFGNDAVVVANGTVQIVSSPDRLVMSEGALDALYEETGKNEGKGTRIGPFVAEGVTQQVAVIPSGDSSRKISLITEAHAQEPRDKDGKSVPNIVIGGTWHIGDGATPPEGIEIPGVPQDIKKIVLNFDFGQDGNVALENFHLVGPDGREGRSTIGEGCAVQGDRGEDAFRFRMKAGNIHLNNFRLELGDGGVGGTAETLKDCDPVARATGGDGGEAGNFKMTAEGTIEIVSFHVVPGVGGNGGNATAYGKDGTDACPGKKGADANAIAGKGGNNKKELSALGSVAGISNVSIDQVDGGWGGQAVASPGKGGNGTGCKCAGGKGGNAEATGGLGGDASVKLVGATGVENGGAGGNADAHGGDGGAGGMCELKPTGGNGGGGGGAVAKAGKGGKGTSGDGAEGTVIDETGGNGGNGGDGCGPGNGGKGGAGKPNGNDGQLGTKKCPDVEKKTGTSVTSPTGSTGTSGGSAGGSETGAAGGTNVGKKKIKVISYNGKYLPVDQLIQEGDHGPGGCGELHWHAATGLVSATDQTRVPDPGPPCGYGKVQEKSVQEIEI